MILDKNEVDARLESPDNLLNRLRRLTGQSQIVSLPSDSEVKNSPASSPLIPPPIDELVDNVKDKLATAECYAGAKEVLKDAINGLKLRVFEVDDPVKLSRIATDMGKIVNGFDENKKEKTGRVVPIIYRPVMLTENNFQSIHVNE